MQTNKYHNMFQKPFSCNGRIRRAEYFISFVFYFFFIGWVYLTLLLFGYYPALILSLGLPPLTWFLIAQGVKRCHDLGNSGFFQYILPYILILIWKDGNPGKNEFGPSPKK